MNCFYYHCRKCAPKTVCRDDWLRSKSCDVLCRAYLIHNTIKFIFANKMTCKKLVNRLRWSFDTHKNISKPVSKFIQMFIYYSMSRDKLSEPSKYDSSHTTSLTGFSRISRKPSLFTSNAPYLLPTSAPVFQTHFLLVWSSLNVSKERAERALRGIAVRMPMLTKIRSLNLSASFLLSD